MNKKSKQILLIIFEILISYHEFINLIILKNTLYLKYKFLVISKFEILY